MINDNIKQLISEYIDRELSPEQMVEVEQLIKNNPECEQYYRELTLLSFSLKGIKNQTLSPDGETNIDRIINQEGKTMKTVIAESRRAVATVAVFFLVLTVSLTVYHQSSFYMKKNLQARVKDANRYQPMTIPTSAATTSMRTGEDKTKEIVLPAQSLSKIGFKSGYQGTWKNTTNEIGDESAFQDAAQMGQPASVQLTAPSENVNNFRKQQLLSEPIAQDMALANIGSARANIAAKRIAGGAQKTQYEPYYLQSEYRVDRDETLYQQIAVSSYISPEFIAPNTEAYGHFIENKFLGAIDNPLSTFSIDVDTASYSNIRRFLNSNQLPPTDSVRIEEMINYFDYDYPMPEGDQPFSITTKASVCPWNTNHQLVMIGLQGKTIPAEQVPASNLVFLVDVSGSMSDYNKLPLLQQGLTMMVNQLSAKERVAIVVYAGAAGQVLASTPGDQEQTIINAINNLQAGGSTAGAQGIELAYQIAQQNFVKEGNNRVILATDGDFNVGITDNNELVKIIEEKRKQGIFLTVLGFGIGNTKDDRMEQLANKGDGNYYYIDTIKEAQKVLISELGSTLFTIAKDVKLQIEFNPALVQSYRLVGYENRMLAKEDFNDDTKDAGELGAGHTVTALYEIVPVGAEGATATVEPLKYQKAEVINSSDLMTVKLRYKNPDAQISQLITQTIQKNDVSAEPTGDFGFAAAVAEFGQLLRQSEYKGNASYQHVIDKAQANMGKDQFGYRAEFLNLVQTASQLDHRSSGPIQFK